MRTRAYIILLFLLLLFSCKKNDSAAYDKNAAIFFDKNYIDKLVKNKKEKYLDLIVDLLKLKKNDSTVRNSYLKTATEYYYINNFKKSLSAS